MNKQFQQYLTDCTAKQIDSIRYNQEKNRLMFLFTDHTTLNITSDTDGTLVINRKEYHENSKNADACGGGC